MDGDVIGFAELKILLRRYGNSGIHARGRGKEYHRRQFLSIPDNPNGVSCFGKWQFDAGYLPLGMFFRPFR